MATTDNQPPRFSLADIASAMGLAAAFLGLLVVAFGRPAAITLMWVLVAHVILGALTSVLFLLFSRLNKRGRNRR